MRTQLICLAVLSVTCLSASPAHAEFQFMWGGRVQSDIRFRVYDVKASTFPNRFLEPAGVSRNFNLAKLHGEAQWSFGKAVAEMDFLWLGVNTQTQVFSDLYERQRVDPLRIKAQAAYVDFYDIFLPGLDFRIGQQIVEWGVGETINPTNVINANDFEDPLLFGYQLANSMIRLDYAFNRDWSITLLTVPVFKPAVLNTPSDLSLLDFSRRSWQQENFRLNQAAAAAWLEAQGYPLAAGTTSLQMPSTSFDNMQWAARIAGNVWNQDIALSYYYGRSDLPMVTSAHSTQVNTPVCDPENPSHCTSGVLRSDATLSYPRFQMIGVNLAGDIPVARIGYHVELGVFFPHRILTRISQGAATYPTSSSPAGEIDYDLGGGLPMVMDTTPFTKWNIGLDYSVPWHGLYFSLQYVRGFVDEFGAGVSSRDAKVVGDAVKCLVGSKGQRCVTENVRSRIGDYLVVTAQASMLSERLKVLLWLIWDLTPIGQHAWNNDTRQREVNYSSPFDANLASAIIAPSITYNLGYGLEGAAGVQAHLGTLQSKFGDPTEGGGLDVWLRAKYTF